MKRLLLILILFAVLCLGACRKEYNILEYQSKDIEAECIINGEYKVLLVKKDSFCTITVKEPVSAMGISFEIGAESAYAVSGEYRVELDKSHIGGICAISEIFSQSEECMTGATEKNEGSLLTFEKDTCTYQITLGENSMPKNVKIYSEAFEYDIEIASIKLT